MTISELTKFIGEEKERLRIKFDVDKMSENEAIFSQTVKLMEEVGELAEQVLASKSHQRQKNKKFSEESLADEVADVIITTLMVANRLDVNVEKALQGKIKKIEARYQ